MFTARRIFVIEVVAAGRLKSELVFRIGTAPMCALDEATRASHPA
jgi:hypothetical protein